MGMEAYDLQGDSETIAQIVALAAEHGLEASAPMSLNSVSDALDSPLGADEIRQLCDVITVVATTGTSVFGFFAAVKTLLGKSDSSKGKSGEVVVKLTVDQTAVGTITAGGELPAKLTGQ